MQRQRGGSAQRQVPLEHCCPRAQLRPQPPQLVLSAATFTQRQLWALGLLQKRFPPVHETQAALSQCCDPAQVFPQEPQFRSSSYRITHAAPQALYGWVQLLTQAPAWQSLSAAQERPQPPQ